MKQQMIVAVSGVKNSGKTTLLEQLIPFLSKRGVQTAVIKHDGHTFAADREGTDTARLLAAGAAATAVFDGEKFQLVKKQQVSEKELIRCFPEADLILLEGFKGSDWPKVEIVRAENSASPVCRPETLLALVTDLPRMSPGAGPEVETQLLQTALPESYAEVPVFGLSDAERLADFLIENMNQRS